MNEPIALVGLGRMGGNMARRLARAGIAVHGHDADAGMRDALARDGVRTHASLDALLDALPSPRTLWLMLPGELYQTFQVTLRARFPRHPLIVSTRPRRSAAA